MGTLRITIELDTDTLDGSGTWASYSARAARQLERAIKSNATHPAVWPEVHPGDWTERPMRIRPRGGAVQQVGRFVIDRSQTGWEV